MIRFYGDRREMVPEQMNIGGVCPHCKGGTHFTLMAQPNTARMQRDGIGEVVLSFSCDLCLRAIPVLWHVRGFEGGNIIFTGPDLILRVREPFDFDHVPDGVRPAIEEALDCLSVSAYNGFAALCRRAVQAISANLGAKGSDRVKKQVDEMLQLTDLSEDWHSLLKEVLLTGHDGAHPHLPPVNADRAAVLLSLVQDLTYELYTRPGKVREAAALRAKAIEQNRPGA